MNNSYSKIKESYENKDTEKHHDVNVLVLSADSWCGWSKKMSGEKHHLEKALKDIDVGLEFVSDKDDKEFKKHVKKHKAQGFPHIEVISEKDGVITPKGLGGYTHHEELAHKVKKLLKNDITKDKSSLQTKLPSGLTVLVLSADSWCGWSKKMSGEKHDIQKALKDIDVDLKFVSDKNNKQEFDDHVENHDATGFPFIKVMHNNKGDVTPPGLGGYIPSDKLVYLLKQLMSKL